MESWEKCCVLVLLALGLQLLLTLRLLGSLLLLHELVFSLTLELLLAPQHGFLLPSLRLPQAY